MPNALIYHDYGSSFWTNTGIRARVDVDRIAYLESYLSYFKCAWAVEEPSYIDRDYHADFAEFYSTMAVELPSTCRRFHLFSRKNGTLESVGEEIVKQAAAGTDGALEKLQDGYLGYLVIRPQGVPAFGRTVLKCYPDDDKPRVFGTRQKYSAHFAGIELWVESIPWQEQDGGVSACASVALWSLFQSVAPREGIHLPTTADVTKATTRFSMPNGRAIPPGLELGQMCLGIRELGLAPIVLVGERKYGINNQNAFSLELFREYSAMLLEARLPFVVGMPLEVEDPTQPNAPPKQSGHAITVVGYQKAVGLANAADDVAGFMQATMPVVYIHDDNFGPGMRHEILEIHDSQESKKKNGARPAVAGILPKKEGKDAKSERKAPLVPEVLIAAVPERLRLSPEGLLIWGTKLRRWSAEQLSSQKIEVFREVAYVRQTDYFQKWLSSEKGVPSDQVGQARYDFQAGQPLPRFLGVVRLRTRHFLLGDLIFDTTASPHTPRICATLEIGQLAQRFVTALQSQLRQLFFKCHRVPLS
ncbi:MAG: hypothetical protein DPW14_09665 [Planctomycetes bacterium]|nr:hypothetical protein [Planctomycetota bacterium]